MSGCHNHPPFRDVLPMQDGWYLDGTTRTPRLVAVPHRMVPGCQYTLSDLGRVDSGCTGCKWRAA